MIAKARLLAVALLALTPAPALAQTAVLSLHDAVGAPGALKLSGSFRVRYEGLDGQYRIGADPTDSLTSLRTLIAAEYKTGALRLGAELQDSRAYGGKPGRAVGANDVNTFEFIQAYVARDFDAPFGAGSTATAQVGRFTLNLGSRRLVAADDYRNATNGYTGLRVDTKSKSGIATTLIYTLPQVRLPDDQASILDNRTRFDRESADLALWGGLLSKRAQTNSLLLETSFFALDERDAPGRPTRDRTLRNWGLRVLKDPAPAAIDYEAEVIHQWGSISASGAAAAPLLNVDADFLHVDTGYTFKGPAKVRVSVEYDYASGDDSDPSFGRFDSLFGMRRAELAPSGIYAAIGRTNLSTPGIRFEATPSKKLDGFFVYRGLWAASATDTFSTTGRRLTPGATTYAGQQLEGRLRYWLVKDVTRLELNGVLLFKSRQLANGSPSETRYISLALTTGF